MLTPPSSLAVFDRPQASGPGWPSPGGEAARWLGGLGGWDIFALITEGGNVCMVSFRGKESAGGTCTSRSLFAAEGIEFSTTRVSGTGAAHLSVTWGPRGDAVLSDVPFGTAKG